MGIKVGNKVRVSKDIPQFYRKYNSMGMFEQTFRVVDIEDGLALLKSTSIFMYTVALPTKYLIKVDAEAKEPKLRFKEYDTVRVKKDCKSYNELIEIMAVDESDKSSTYLGDDGEWYADADLEPYTEPTAPTIKVGDRVRCKNPIRLANSTDNDFIGTVTDAENGWFIVHMNNGAIFQTYHESDLELVQPTEQTEASADVLGEFTPIPRFYNPIIGFKQAYWQEYEADLAKEIALKVVNKYSDPTEAAEYAVRVAKAVVENLKRK